MLRNSREGKNQHSWTIEQFKILYSIWTKHIIHPEHHTASRTKWHVWTNLFRLNILFMLNKSCIQNEYIFSFNVTPTALRARDNAVGCSNWIILVTVQLVIRSPCTDVLALYMLYIEWHPQRFHLQWEWFAL